jgi:hypothetical protein
MKPRGDFDESETNKPLQAVGLDAHRVPLQRLSHISQVQKFSASE